MKKEFLTIALKVEKSEEEVVCNFETQIKGKVASILSNDEAEKIRKHTSSIVKIVNNAIKNDISKKEEEIEEFEELKSEIKKRGRELYDKLPDDEKRQVDEFEKALEECETEEEMGELFIKILASKLKELL